MLSAHHRARPTVVVAVFVFVVELPLEPVLLKVGPAPAPRIAGEHRRATRTAVCAFPVLGRDTAARQ